MPFVTAPLIAHLTKRREIKPLVVDLYTIVGIHIIRVSLQIDRATGNLTRRRTLPRDVFNLFQALPVPFFGNSPRTATYIDVSYKSGHVVFAKFFENDTEGANLFVLLKLLSAMVTDGEDLNIRLEQAELDDLTGHILQF